jgi:hypothetical protein
MSALIAEQKESIWGVAMRENSAPENVAIITEERIKLILSRNIQAAGITMVCNA